ncbi:MAG: winged helix-turn-helix domain-containing protein [Haloferacaceae archaeon]
MDDDSRAEEILDTLGDRHARRVLAAVEDGECSANDIATRLDLSLPTVYRRLETLTEHDLVDDRTLVADDGNHYTVYDCAFESTVVSLESGTYEVRVFRTDDASDRFRQLWDELSGGTSS